MKKISFGNKTYHESDVSSLLIFAGTATLTFLCYNYAKDKLNEINNKSIIQIKRLLSDKKYNIIIENIIGNDLEKILKNGLN